MTLPTGDDQTIIWRIVVEAAKALKDVQDMRQKVEELKDAMKQTASSTGESFEAIKASIGGTLKKGIDDAKKSIKELKDALKELETQSKTGKKLDASGGRTVPVNVVDVNKQIAEQNKLISDATKKLAEQTIAWKQFQSVSTAAVRELNQETKQITLEELKQRILQMSQDTKQSFVAVKNSMATSFQTGINNAKASLQSLQATLASLQNQAKAGINLQTGQQLSPAQMAQLNAQIAQQKTLITNATTALQQQINAYKQFQSVAPQAVQQLNQAAGGASSSMGKLGMTSSVFFGTILARMATQALRAVVDLLKEAAQSGYEFVKALYQLEVGIRALRRAGVEITLTEFTENLDRLREKFTVFSKKELVEGGAAFVNLIRDMGFTKNEIFELQDSIATLAIVNGRAMDDVQRTVALALSSGYTEGLQRLGISINRVTIAQKAATLGWTGGYNALTEMQRAEATRILILEKTTKYENDLIAYRKTSSGQLDELKALNKDLAAGLGDDLIPAMQLWQEILIGIYNVLSKIISVAGPVLEFFAALGKVNLDTLNEEGKAPSIFTKEYWQRAVKIMDEGSDLAARTIRKVFGGKIAGVKPWEEEPIFTDEVPVGEGQDEAAQALANLFEDFEDIGKDGSDKLKALEADLQADLADIAQRGKEKREDIWQDYWDDLAKIDREGVQKEAGLLTDYQDKLKKIDLDLEFDIKKADFKFDFDVAETAIKLNEDIAKANEEFRQKEADRERKYNEDLLRLREDYLVDLEEALSNRDAKAVLRARKELTLAKDRAARENEFDKIKNQEGLAEDIRDAQLRREARIRELQFELEQRRLELERQAQFDREMAWAGYQADLEALRLSIQQEKAERAIAREEDLRDQLIDEQRDIERRKAKYEAELEELKAFNDEKIRLLGEALAAQATLMNISNEEVLKNIKAVLGDGGLAIQVYEAFLKNVRNLIEAFSKSISGVDPSKFNLPFDKNTTTGSKPGFATGGAVIAKKPTDVTFGEVPEVAIFSPLSEIDKLPSLLGGLVGGSERGSLGIRIALSPGLEAEIVEQSMDKIANVMFEVQRQ